MPRSKWDRSADPRLPEIVRLFENGSSLRSISREVKAAPKYVREVLETILPTEIINERTRSLHNRSQLDLYQRICTICSRQLPLEEFAPHPHAKYGRRNQCKKCLQDYNRKWRNETPGVKERYATKRRLEYQENVENIRESQRISRLKRKYGLTPSEYQELLDSQNNLCAICKKPGKPRPRNNPLGSLCVDHDHVTRKVRGLLCNTCNLALGYLDDNITLFHSAITYLERNVSS